MAVPPIPYHEGTARLPDGRLLGFAEFGDPDGRPVLWFHGTPGARKQLAPDTPDEARQRNLRIVSIERPGTGISTPHLYDQVLDYAYDVECFVDAMDIDRFGVAGLSGGGPFVLACASHLPERVVAGAVLGGIGPTCGPETAPGYTRLLAPFSPVLGFAEVPLANLLNVAVPPLRAVASPAFDLYTRLAPACDRPVLREPGFKAMFLQDLSDALDHGFRAPIFDLYLFSKPWGFSLREIEVPIRFWHGDADRIVPLSHGIYQNGLVPDSNLVIVPRGGHFSGFETVPVVLDLFDEMWPATRSRASAG
jgi:pimeloyl-ACP methyl ester carboxylesterase